MPMVTFWSVCMALSSSSSKLDWIYNSIEYFINLSLSLIVIRCTSYIRISFSSWMSHGFMCWTHSLIYRRPICWPVSSISSPTAMSLCGKFGFGLDQMGCIEGIQYFQSVCYLTIYLSIFFCFFFILSLYLSISYSLILDSVERGIKAGDFLFTYKSIFQDVRRAVDWVHSDGDLKRRTTQVSVRWEKRRRL